MPRSRKNARPSNPEHEMLLRVWLPIESKVQAVGGELPLRDKQSEERHRNFFLRFFEERDAGQESALEVAESFGNILALYQHHLAQRCAAGEEEERAKTEALGDMENEPSFLRLATTYSVLFREWMVDHLSRTDKRFAPDEESGSIKAIRADNYHVNTSQEAMTLLTAICSGKSGRNWKSDNQGGTRIYQRPDTNHRVQLGLSHDERDAGLTTTALEELTKQLDADGMFAVLYVSRLLAPPTPLPRNMMAYDWIELDDVITKIGWKPRSTVERLEMRRTVWNYLKFCARANLIGQRSTSYYDPDSKKEIPTRIEAPIWRFMKEEKPLELSLFAENDVPLRVQIAVSPEWTRLTSSPALAQFLPMGELLGQIAPGKPSGAWARALGISLAGFWRRKLPEEILEGSDPRRALDYWRGALQILVEIGFIEKSGEAARSEQEMMAAFPRKGWQGGWMNEAVEIRPGAQMREAVERCADKRPELPSRNPKSPTKRKKKV